VNGLGLLLRFLAVLLIVRLVARALVRALAPPVPPAPMRPAAARPPLEELVRDRICNTFVTRSRAVVATVAGREEPFCSTTCRDKALAGS
jgi:hypothetical protein